METDIPYLSKVFKEEYESIHNCESHIFKCSFHIELQNIMDQIATVHDVLYVLYYSERQHYKLFHAISRDLRIF